MASMLEPTQPGKREMLAAIIQNIDKGRTPFISRVKRSAKPTNTLMQWQVDNYPDPRYTGVLDGSDVSSFEYIGDREKIGNYIVYIRYAPGVGELAQEVSDVAGLGVGQEMANQITKSLKMCARSAETACLLDGQDAQAQAGTTPYATRSVGKWASTSAGTVQPIPAAYLPAAGNQSAAATASITEDDIVGMMSSAADAAKGPTDFVGFFGTTARRAISKLQSYAPGSTIPLRRTSEAQGVLEQSVTKMVNDYGSLELVLDYFLVKDTAYSKVRGFIIDPEMYEIAYNRMPRVRELPNLGGGPRAEVSMIFGLVCRNPLTTCYYNPTA